MIAEKQTNGAVDSLELIPQRNRSKQLRVSPYRYHLITQINQKNDASDLFGQEILTRKCVIVILFLKEIVCACATNKQNIGALCPENLEQ